MCTPYIEIKMFAITTSLIYKLEIGYVFIV